MANSFWRRSRKKVIAEQRTASSRFCNSCLLNKLFVSILEMQEGYFSLVQLIHVFHFSFGIQNVSVLSILSFVDMGDLCLGVTGIPSESTAMILTHQGLVSCFSVFIPRVHNDINACTFIFCVVLSIFVHPFFVIELLYLQ